MYAKIFQGLLQRFFVTMGRAPLTPKEWSKLRARAMELSRKEGGDPITGAPFPGWKPRVIQGGKGLDSLMKKGDVTIGKAPKTTKETLKTKKDRHILLRDADEAIVDIKRKNKEAIERFKEKMDKNKPKTVEDFRDKGDWDPGGMAEGGIAPLVGEPSYAADFYDDRTPMKKGKKAKKKKKKKTARRTIEEILEGLTPEEKKKVLKRFMPSPWRQLPHGRQRYRSIKDLPEGILELLQKDPGFDRENFEKAYWAGEDFRWTDPGWSEGMRGSYSPMTGNIELNLAPFGEEEYPHWQLKKPHVNASALKDVDKAKIALHELRHKNIMEDQNLFKTQPEWVQRSEGAGYLPKGGVTGHELYNRFLDQRYYPPEEKPGKNEPYFDKILKDYWEPYAKDYESTAKRRLSERHGEGIETLAAQGGRIGLAGGGGIIKLLKKFLKKKPKKDVIKPFEFPDVGPGSDFRKKLLEDMLRSKSRLKDFDPKGKPHAAGGRIGLAGGGALFKFIEKLFIKASNDIRLGRGKWKGLDQKQIAVQHDNLTKKVTEFQKTGNTEGLEIYFDVNPNEAFAAASKKVQSPLQKEVSERTGKVFDIKTEQYVTPGKKVDKDRLATADELEDAAEILDPSGETGAMDVFDEGSIIGRDPTKKELDKMLQDHKDYVDNQYQRYKRGDLDKYVKPEVLEEQRLFRQKKIDNVLAKAYDEVFYQKPVSGDYKYDADVLSDSIAEQLGKGAYTDLPQTHQTQIYNTALKRVTQDMKMKKTLKNVEEKMILSDFKTKDRLPNQSGGPVDQEALIQMYLAEGLSYEEAVQAAQATSGLDMDISKKAEGGIMREGHIFGGSAGLKAMWKQMLKNLSKGKDKPVKRLFPTLSADERRMERLVMGMPEQKAFREGEEAHKLEGIDILINRLKHDKKILERQAKNKEMGDPGLDFLMKKLEENMSEAYTPHLKKYTDIDKDILQMENIKKNLIMKDRKLNAYGGRIGYAGGGKAGLPAITYGMPQGPGMQQPQMPAGPQPAGIPGGTIVAQNQMQQAPWMGQQMQQGMGGMPQRGQPRPGGMPPRGQPRPGGMLRPMAAEGGRIGYAGGGFNKARRAFLKMLAGITGTGIAAGTGILRYGSKAAPKAIKETTEVIARGADGMPTYITDLIEVVKAKGTRDVIEGFKKSDYSTVHSYKGVEVIEEAGGATRIKKGQEKPLYGSDEPSYHEVEMEIRPQYDEMIEPDSGVSFYKDADGKMHYETKVPDDYTEYTAKPDMDGKLKDVEEGIDEIDHLDLKSIADELHEEGFFYPLDAAKKLKKASGGLARMLGE